MRTEEFIGKTAEDAIRKGLEQLGVAREDVEIKVLDEGSRGVFGIFAKMARVEITVPSLPEAEKPEEPEETEEPEEQPAEKPARRNGRRNDRERTHETAEEPPRREAGPHRSRYAARDFPPRVHLPDGHRAPHGRERARHCLCRG